ASRFSLPASASAPPSRRGSPIQVGDPDGGFPSTTSSSGRALADFRGLAAYAGYIVRAQDAARGLCGLLGVELVQSLPAEGQLLDLRGLLHSVPPVCPGGDARALASTQEVQAPTSGRTGSRPVGRCERTERQEHSG